MPAGESSLRMSQGSAGNDPASNHTALNSATANSATANSATANSATANSATANSATANSATANSATANSATANSATADGATANGATADDRLDRLTVLVPQGMHTGSMSAIAYFLIRDLIVTLELAPGTPLRERDLMERLQLGRTPVREALHRLADQDLVAIYARRGMAVAPVDVHELASVSEVRVELEGLAARLAVQRGTKTDHTAAAELVAELDHGLDPGDPRALIRLDQRVHHCMHRATHNAYLESTLDEYLALSLRLWFLGLDEVSRLDESVAEHRDLLTAIMNQDGAAAEKVARTHVTGFWDEIRRVVAT